METYAEEKPFNEDNISLVDIAFAPLFTRLKLTPSIYNEVKEKASTALIQWIDGITNMDAVKNSTRDDFESEWHQYFQKRNSHSLQIEAQAA